MKKILAAVLLLMPLLCGCTLLEEYMANRLEQELEYHAPVYSVEDCTHLTTDGSDTTVENPRQKEAFRNTYGLGTCHTLSGKQTVVLFFVDDNESSWSAEDVTEYTETQIFPALSFLKSEAEARGVELDFEIKRFSTPLSGGLKIKYTGVINRDLEVGGSTKDVPHQIASRLGCSSPLTLLGAMREEFQTEAIIPLVLIQSNGLSYARYQLSEGVYDHMEYAVMFSDKWNATTGQWRHTSARSAYVAHHILALFGGENYYSSDSREAMAEEYYPFDIMLMDYNSLYLLDVGDYTAFCVGWTDTIPTVCRKAAWYAP